MASMTFYADQDASPAVVDQTYWSYADFFQLKNNQWGAVGWGIVHFPVSGIPAGAQITGVTYNAKTRYINQATTIRAFRITQSWTEADYPGGSQQNPPTYDSANLLGSIPFAASTGSWNSINLSTSLVTNWLNGTWQNYGIVLSCDYSSNAETHFYTREAGADQHYLTVTYNSAPTVPTRVSPAEGAVLNKSSSQLFDWNHNDPDGDAQAKYQFWVNGTGGGYWNGSTFVGSPTYITSSTTQVTIPANTLPANMTVWQVLTQDPGGLNSPWSAEFGVTVDSPPNTPTLDSPANGATIYAGQSNTFQFDATDPDSGDSMASYALRITIDGVTRYWRASDNTWQAAETFNPSAQAFPVSNKQIVIPAHEFNDFDSQGTGTWSVAVRDTAGLTSAYSSTRSLTISQGFIGWGVPV